MKAVAPVISDQSSSCKKSPIRHSLLYARRRTFLRLSDGLYAIIEPGQFQRPSEKQRFNAASIRSEVHLNRAVLFHVPLHEWHVSARG